MVYFYYYTWNGISGYCACEAKTEELAAKKMHKALKHRDGYFITKITKMNDKLEETTLYDRQNDSYLKN